MILRVVEEIIEHRHLLVKYNAIILCLDACSRHLLSTNSILLKLPDDQLLCFLQGDCSFWVLNLLPKSTFLKPFDDFIILDFLLQIQFNHEIRYENLDSQISTDQVHSNLSDLGDGGIRISHLNAYKTHGILNGLWRQVWMMLRLMLNLIDRCV